MTAHQPSAESTATAKNLQTSSATYQSSSEPSNQSSAQSHLSENTKVEHEEYEGLYEWHADNLLKAVNTPINIDSQNESYQQSYWQIEQQKQSADNLQQVSINSQRITTDTRKLQQGDIFLALAGDNFDGHDYVSVAQQKGAVAVIVERPVDSSLPQLIVGNSRLALGRLAAYRRHEHQSITIIALTGSSGKTTCKEMLGSIFSRLAPTLITRGNLNNDLGVPMMLLELSEKHRYAIIELGANHQGEIAYTADIVRPDVACVLNVGTAHLGEFGSREIICQTKAEIYQNLTDTQYAIVPDTDDFASQLRDVAQQHTNKVIGFGQHTNSEIKASEVQIYADHSQFVLHIGQQTQTVKLPLVGEHNVTNALAVSACASALGVSIKDIVTGLEQARPAKGRLNSQLFGRHQLIDDTYNANPHSVRASAQVLASQAGQRILVLGDIAELGDKSKIEHYNLGRDIASMDIDMLLCVGEYAQDCVAGATEVGGIERQAFTNKEALLAYLQPYLQVQQNPTCTVLFKGSRSMKMETLIKTLVEE